MHSPIQHSKKMSKSNGLKALGKIVGIHHKTSRSYPHSLTSIALMTSRESDRRKIWPSSKGMRIWFHYRLGWVQPIQVGLGSGEEQLNPFGSSNLPRQLPKLQQGFGTQTEKIKILVSTPASGPGPGPTQSYYMRDLGFNNLK